MDNTPLHAEVQSEQQRPATANPLGSSLNIVVSVPDSIEIRMVDASTLSDYEVWFFMSSVLASAVVGFIVAFIQACDSTAPNMTSLGYTAVMFLVLFLVALITTFVKRNSLRKKAKTVRLRATDQGEQ